MSAWTTDPNGPPLYQQVRADLERRIRTGEFAPGQFLPSEQQLCEQYGVSRTTIRTAVGMLVNMGLVHSVRGRGIQVTGRITQRLNVFKSMTDIIREQGYTPGVHVLRVAAVEPDVLIKTQLRLESGPIYVVERIRTANGQPVNLSTSFLPPAWGAQITPDKLTEEVSLYRLLEKIGCTIRWVEDQLSARLATPREASLLGLEPGAPVLVLERVAFDDHDRPVERATSVIRSDIFHYTVRTARTNL